MSSQDPPPIPQAPPLVPESYPQAFEWWRQRFHGKEFPYLCGGCGIEIGIQKRVTISTRTCPNCGAVITTDAIDRQLDAREPARRKAMQGCLAGASALVVGTLIIPLFF